MMEAPLHGTAIIICSMPRVPPLAIPVLAIALLGRIA